MPVCLGIMEPVLPLYCDGGVYNYLLFLSWAGRSLLYYIQRLDYTAIVEGVQNVYALLHDY